MRVSRRFAKKFTKNILRMRKSFGMGKRGYAHGRGRSRRKYTYTRSR